MVTQGLQGEGSRTSPRTDGPSSEFSTVPGCADPSMRLRNVSHLSFPGQQALGYCTGVAKAEGKRKGRRERRENGFL